jgi:hypothetical protein
MHARDCGHSAFDSADCRLMVRANTTTTLSVNLSTSALAIAVDVTAAPTGLP